MSIPISAEEAKELLKKNLKDMNAEERKKLKEAIHVVSQIKKPVS